MSVGRQRLFRPFLLGHPYHYVVGQFILLLLLLSCSREVAGTSSDNLAPGLETSAYDSQEIDAAFRYPRGWVLDEGSGHVYLAESSEYFPVGIDYFSSPPGEPYYVMYRVSPFRAGLFGLQRSPVEAATEIAKTFEAGHIQGTLLEPIVASQVNNLEVATLAIEAGDQVDYLMIVAVQPKQLVAIAGYGPRDKLVEIREVVAGIASSLEPLE